MSNRNACEPRESALYATCQEHERAINVLEETVRQIMGELELLTVPLPEGECLVGKPPNSNKLEGRIAHLQGMTRRLLELEREITLISEVVREI